MDLSWRIDGATQILNRISVLPTRMQSRIARRSARRAMTIVRDRAKENARRVDDPLSSRRIWKNVAIQESRRQSKAVGGIVMRVGILGGARQYAGTRANRRAGRAGQTFTTGGSSDNPGGDTWYWRLIEFGTEKMAARPFLRPALESSVPAVYERLVAELTAGIDAEL